MSTNETAAADCPFCGIAAGRIPATLLYDDEHAVAFDDITPQAPVHSLVIPRRHIATLEDSREEDAWLLGHLMRVAVRVAGEKDIGTRGYRVVVNCRAEAGQSVFHLHFHVLGGRSMSWPPG